MPQVSTAAEKSRVSVRARVYANVVNILLNKLLQIIYVCVLFN